MNSPDPITMAGIIGAFTSIWKARAFGIPIATTGWHGILGFCARSLRISQSTENASAAAQSTVRPVHSVSTLLVNLAWAAHGKVGLLAIGRTSRVQVEAVIPPVANAADTTIAGPKPLWEAGTGGFAGAVADYTGANQYRVRGLFLPFLIHRGEFFRSDANESRLQKSSGIIECEFSGGGSLASNSKCGARPGMPNLDYLLDTGPMAKIIAARPTDTSRLMVDLALRDAISTKFLFRLSKSRSGY